MLPRVLGVAAAVALALAPVPADAAVVLEGPYLKLQISDLGTIGPGLDEGFGILVDRRGTSRHSIDILNGLRHEGFAVFSEETGTVENANGIAGFGDGSVREIDGVVTWQGRFGDFLEIAHSFSLDPSGLTIVVETTITALQDLTGVVFGRSIDPSPDASLETDPGIDPFETDNTRGGVGFDPARRVFGLGPLTGIGIALIDLTQGSGANTGVSDFCCATDVPGAAAGYGPRFPLFERGDFGLQMAWRIGDLAAGESVAIQYLYQVEVPEPASLALLGLGLAALALARRRA
jgi:hypothetical protein